MTDVYRHFGDFPHNRQFPRGKNVTTPPCKTVTRISIDIVNPQQRLHRGHSDVHQEYRKRTPKHTPKSAKMPETEAKSTELHVQRKQRKMAKGIMVSYSPDAAYLERKFVLETVRQLKENNLAGDIWLDKDENMTDSPCWFSTRMEAVERCRASILILSDSYFMCPVSMYEGKVLLERQRTDPDNIRNFIILFSPLQNMQLPKEFKRMRKFMVDLTTPNRVRLSLDEKSSIVVGALMGQLEQVATVNKPPTPFSSSDHEFNGEYKNKKICQWGVSDLQEWLFSLQIKEFYRQSLAENQIDGFLLMSLTDYDMIHHLGIDSRVVRKKIMQHILQTLDKEHKQLDNWHLRARAQRPKVDTIYLIYDPADVRLAQNVKSDLKRKNIQVIHHDSLRLGKSKEEFLQINGPQIALANNVAVLLTEAATTSPFVFHEILFADWLGKKILTAVFRNTWTSLRPSLKAVLGDCPAIDFECKMYTESVEVLEHHVKPLRRVPGVILEQEYLNKMADGLKPLEVLSSQKNVLASSWPFADPDSKVYLSYQWDTQIMVETIKHALEAQGIPCWSDVNATQRLNSSLSNRSNHSAIDCVGDTLQSQIQRTIKTAAVVISCITPKYLQSENCIKDLTLAETFRKPIIPILLRFSPSDGAPAQVRKILSRYSYIDLSNDRLHKQNLRTLIEKVKKVAGTKS